MAAGVSALIREENPDIQIRVVPGGGLANPTRINNGQSQIGWGIDAFSASAVRGVEPYSAKHEKIRCFGTATRRPSTLLRTTHPRGRRTCAASSPSAASARRAAAFSTTR